MFFDKRYTLVLVNEHVIRSFSGLYGKLGPGFFVFGRADDNHLVPNTRGKRLQFSFVNKLLLWMDIDEMEMGGGFGRRMDGHKFLFV